MLATRDDNGAFNTTYRVLEQRLRRQTSGATTALQWLIWLKAVSGLMAVSIILSKFDDSIFVTFSLIGRYTLIG
jgi:hypothetical protein